MTDAHDDAGHPLPDYDPVVVGRIAGRVEITDVELVLSHFERDDDGPRPPSSPRNVLVEPTIRFEPEWDLSDDQQTLAFLVRFMIENEDDPRFSVIAFFRLTYTVSSGPELDPSDIDLFAHWNVIFNAWPYFREYVSSTVNRAGLPRFALPVMRVPRAKQ